MQRGEQREADLLGGEEVAGGEGSGQRDQNAALGLQLCCVLYSMSESN